MYKKIAAISSEEDKFEIEDELIDRYGDYPGAVQNIIDVAALKTKARQAGVYEIKQIGKVLQFKLVKKAISAALIKGLNNKYLKRIQIDDAKETIIRLSILHGGKNILSAAEEFLDTVNKL